jgi:hypothetical protein
MRVWQAPRGFVVNVSGIPVARVIWCRNNGDHEWYWYGGNESLGVPWRNTAIEGRFFDTKEVARDDVVAYVKKSVSSTK